MPGSSEIWNGSYTLELAFEHVSVFLIFDVFILDALDGSYSIIMYTRILVESGGCTFQAREQILLLFFLPTKDITIVHRF